MTVSVTYPLEDGAFTLETEEVDAGLPKEPEEITDHCLQGQDRFIEPFKSKPRLDALLCVYLDQVQELEAVLWDVLVDRYIDTAVGVQLDVLGSIVGQGRLGLGDDDYRTLIRARIKVNLSDGHPEQLIEILSLIQDPDEPGVIELYEYPPASFIITILGDIGSLDPALAFLLLNAARAAGVGFSFVFSTEPLGEQFTLDSDTTQTLDVSLGLGDTLDLTDGGKLTSAMGT